MLTETRPHYVLSETYQKRAITHLKSTIKALAAKVRAKRQAARKTVHWERWQLKHEANQIGSGCIRPRHLAYGLLRGVPYRAMEPESTRLDDYGIDRLVASIQVMLDEAFRAPASDVYTADMLKMWMKHDPVSTSCAA